jgi:hypothetical protein
MRAVALGVLFFCAERRKESGVMCRRECCAAGWRCDSEAERSAGVAGLKAMLWSVFISFCAERRKRERRSDERSTVSASAARRGVRLAGAVRALLQLESGTPWAFYFFFAERRKESGVMVSTVCTIAAASAALLAA